LDELVRLREFRKRENVRKGKMLFSFLQGDMYNLPGGGGALTIKKKRKRGFEEKKDTGGKRWEKERRFSLEEDLIHPRGKKG